MTAADFPAQAVEPRAAYLHVPFCRRRCGYCNFTVLAGRDDLFDAYLNALECELSQLDHPRPVDTLFVGGGTPTHLPPPQLDRLLQIATHWFPLAPDGEFSIEANPADLRPEKLEILQAAGATRISVGLQSFDAAKLQCLERDHTPAQIATALENCRGRFASISLDLIFGVPGETLATWNHDLDAAIEQQPGHLSTYGLTFDKGAAFWGRLAKGQLVPPGEEIERAMYLAAIERLTSAGWEHYEVSNFALPGHRCRHNEAYWLGREYFAAGPGAARYVNGIRETNHRSTTTWLKRLLAGLSPVAERERLDPEARARERLVFQLRMLAGVDIARFEAETHWTIDGLAGEDLRELEDLGLLCRQGPNLRLSREGLLVSDAIWPRLLVPRR